MKPFRISTASRILFAVIAILAANIANAQINYIPLHATSMLFCPQDNRIYATGDSKSPGDLANTICRINPDNGAIEASVFVGDNPTGIIRTTDNKYLYVLIAGKKMIRQVERATMKAGLTFPVGNNREAHVIAPVPDNDDAIMVLQREPDQLCVYVKGRQATDGVGSGRNFAYGIDPTRVITCSEGSSNMFYCGINAMLHTDAGSGFFGGSQVDLRASGFGLIVGSNGDIVDPEARQVLGQLPEARGQFTVDPVRPVVYDIYDDRGPMMRGYDLRTFRKIWEAPLPTWKGDHNPIVPLRYGRSGFAYIDNDYIVCGQWRLGPESKPVDLSVGRSGLPKAPQSGREYTYTLTVTNNSDNPSHGAYLTETLPGANYVLETTPSQGTAVVADGVVRADLGDILAHHTATLKIHIKIVDRGLGGYVAVIRSYDPDPDTSNNLYAGTDFTPHALLATDGATATVNATWNALSRAANGAGDDLKIQINGELVIENKGKERLSASSVRFYLQEGPSLVIDWAVLLQEVQVPSLAPGERYTVSLSAPVTIDSDVVGMYVIADIIPSDSGGPKIRSGKQIP